MGDQASSQIGKRVLVVDDDPEVIQILEVNLEHANFEVISARNGAQALAKAFKERPDLILLDIILPDLDGLEVCRQLKERLQTSHIPIIIISAKVENEDKIAGIIAGAEDYITKPFVPSEVVALVEARFKQQERSKNANPLTELPNRTQINNEITYLISQNKTFAAIHVDIDSFKGFNNVYGFTQGDRVLRLLTEILREAVRLFGNPNDLVGHLDGDDFIVISTPQRARILCQKIIADFDSRVITLYRQEDSERGYIEYKGRLGQREQHPILSLSVAVVTNERRIFDNYLQISEVATELRDYLRRLPGSNYYFDRRENGRAESSLLPKFVPSAHREDLKAVQGILAWVTFLTKELEVPATVIKDSLESLLQSQVKNFDSQQLRKVESVQESIGQLQHTMEELKHLGKAEWRVDGATLDEVDLKDILDWVLTQLQELMEQQEVEVDIEWAGEVSRLLVDGRSLMQGLFYLLRSEVKSSAPGDRVQVRVSEATDTFITMEIINRHRYISPRELTVLFRGELEGVISSERRNDLYLARVLVWGFGGKLQVKSKEGEGTVFTIFIPKRWQSSAEQSNRLRSEIETCSSAVRDQIKSIRYLLSSAIEDVPSAVEESFENLSHKMQQTEVLCNRSLFLADDLSSQLERQQSRLLQQELEQTATSETVLTLIREIAKLVQGGYLFDPESAQRVAKNALVIAGEFKLSRSEQQALYHAALLKDLGLASVPWETLVQRVAPTPETALSLREYFNIVERALSRLNFLAPAISLVLHSYERHDGKGYPSGLGGAKIPLGAKILAIADAFDAMVSGLWPQGKLDPEMAVKELAADSGKRFDPQVVGVFLKVWRGQGLQSNGLKQS